MLWRNWIYWSTEDLLLSNVCSQHTQYWICTQKVSLRKEGIKKPGLPNTWREGGIPGGNKSAEVIGTLEGLFDFFCPEKHMSHQREIQMQLLHMKLWCLSPVESHLSTKMLCKLLFFGVSQWGCLHLILSWSGFKVAFPSYFDSIPRQP